MLRHYAYAAEKEIGEVNAGRLPDRGSHANGKKAFEKMKEIRNTTRLAHSPAAMIRALASHSETDWLGRPFLKRFGDADEALSLVVTDPDSVEEAVASDISDFTDSDNPVFESDSESD